MLADAPVPGQVDREGTATLGSMGWPGLVELVEVAPAGRKRMTGAEWARGARIQPGEHLG